MPATIQHEGGNLYRVNASGLLLNRELDVMRDTAIEAIARLGSIRLLFVLEKFEGWERGVDWGDMTFYRTHGKNIEQIAVIGEETWRDHALMFAGAGLRRAPVQYFLPAETEQARAWLTPQGRGARTAHPLDQSPTDPPNQNP
jgi:hypothetical protein